MKSKTPHYIFVRFCVFANVVFGDCLLFALFLCLKWKSRGSGTSLKNVTKQKCGASFHKKNSV